MKISKMNEGMSLNSYSQITDKQYIISINIKLKNIDVVMKILVSILERYW